MCVLDVSHEEPSVCSLDDEMLAALPGRFVVWPTSHRRARELTIVTVQSRALARLYSSTHQPRAGRSINCTFRVTLHFRVMRIIRIDNPGRPARDRERERWVASDACCILALLTVYIVARAQWATQQQRLPPIYIYICARIDDDILENLFPLVAVRAHAHTYTTYIWYIPRARRAGYTSGWLVSSTLPDFYRAYSSIVCVHALWHGIESNDC